MPQAPVNFGSLAPEELPWDIGELIQPKQKRPWGQKRWCYVGVVHPDFFFGAAMVHLGYITHAFAYAVDRKTRKMVEDARLFPPLGKIRFNAHPHRGQIRFSAPGGHLSLKASGTGHHLKIAFPRKNLFGNIQLSLPDGGFKFRHFYLPMAKGNKAFTTKAAGLKAKGSLTFNGQTRALGDGAQGLLDWTQGVYPRRTQWNWACGTGVSDRDIPLSFNFSRGVYEYGQLENTIWIQGRPLATGPMRFDYDGQKPHAPWKIHSSDGRVNLDFIPQGIRQGDENLGIVHSQFIQPQGRFQGSFTLPNGQVHTLGEVSGVTEAHFAKW